MIIFRIVCLIASLFFCLSALAQINDPDCEIWIVTYFLPAVIALTLSVKPSLSDNIIVQNVNKALLMVCFLFGGYILTTYYDSAQTFSQWIIHEESGREFGGLLIVFLWTSYVYKPGRVSSTLPLIFAAGTIVLPTIFWLHVYFNESIRKFWPRHCQSLVYPDQEARDS